MSHWSQEKIYGGFIQETEWEHVNLEFVIIKLSIMWTKKEDNARPRHACRRNERYKMDTEPCSYSGAWVYFIPETLQHSCSLFSSHIQLIS